MSRTENCPTCGTKLGTSQARASMRTCNACHRSNPAMFNYCGWCASPMENTEMRARIAELAAPPGGWPNLTSELVEVRFYLQQGLFDDAYELLSIMQKRHPGHPQLTELSHRPKPARRVDTDTIALVDSVLAESANLVGRMPRRAAPKWKGSAAPPGIEDDDEPTQRPRGGKSGPHPSARTRSGSQRTTSEPARGARSASGSQRAAGKPTGPQPRASGKTGTTGAQQRTGARTGPRAAATTQEPAPPRERTRIYRTAEPPRTVADARAAEAARAEAARAEAAAKAEAARAEQTRRTEARVEAARAAAASSPRGATMAVDALQPPAPWSAPAEEAAPNPRARKRREAAPAPAPAAPAPAEEAETEQKEGRRRRASFGEHVLNRLR
ncbi:MAG TPA: zinc ribbon domain-containing protein [Nannocystaceae bacterium]|nr:zinc ribbon domain-containing protein [Nannocystaceae bacterium]